MCLTSTLTPNAIRFLMCEFVGLNVFQLTDVGERRAGSRAKPGAGMSTAFHCNTASKARGGKRTTVRAAVTDCYLKWALPGTAFTPSTALPQWSAFGT